MILLRAYLEKKSQGKILGHKLMEFMLRRENEHENIF